MKPSISVVMPTHNRAPLLARVLEAYEAQSGDFPFELIVVDDASTDDTRALLEAYAARRFRLTPISLERNGGPGRARNLAMTKADAPLVAIVGDDIMPSETFLAGHLATHESHPDTDLAVLGLTTWPDDLDLNSLMRHVDGPGAQQFSYTHMRDGQELDFRHFYTSNVSIKRSLLDRVPTWFDPDFVHAAYEDAEFAYRLTRAGGLRVRYTASIRATHYHPYVVRTFASRQYKCGLMASVFLGKHPELRSLWRTNRLDRLRRLVALPPLRGFLSRLTDAEIEAAQQTALALGAECEAREGRSVDRIYLVLLEYFVLKGMLEGCFGVEGGRRPGAALLLFGLLHHLGVIVSDPESKDLRETTAGQALLEADARYSAVRQSWPRGLRWLLLSPVRKMSVPGY